MIKTLTSTALLAVAAAIVALAAAGHTAQAATSTPLCQPGNFTTKVTPGSPGMGNRYARLTLTNDSGHACHTGGYVGLGLTGNSIAQKLPTRVIRTDAGAERELVLAPGQSASTQLHWTVVPEGNNPNASCDTQATHIEVTPPNTYDQLWLKWTQGTLCNFGQIDVTPLAAG